MSYLLDSDVLISQLAGDRAVSVFVRTLFTSEICISVITYMEVFEGTLSRPDPVAAEMELAEAISAWSVLEISPGIADECARSRHELRANRRPVRTRALDLLIAATAIHHDLTLVTRNLGDYQDIKGLRLVSPPLVGAT